MEWIKKDLVLHDEDVSCCDKGNKVIMICTSSECRQKQRLICMKCSIVHKDHIDELIKIKDFIKQTSEMHDSTKRVQNYKEDLPDQPINYVDIILMNSIGVKKQNFFKQIQDIQKKVSIGVKKQLGHLEAFQRSRVNVMKLDKKKGSTLDFLSSEHIEMIIDMYWKKHKDYNNESEVPHFVESQIKKCSENIGSLLNDVFLMINEEANKCLSKVRQLIRENRIEELKKEMDSKDNSPPRFPKPRKCQDIQKRPISSRLFNKPIDIDNVEQKLNDQQDQIKKDLEKLQDNKQNLFSENSNLQDLNERYFSQIAERIQAKKGEIERMEKCKNIQNLKIARNQLNTLIKQQVQTYKSFNAQQLRVDNKILEVLKNLEYKEEELNESKIISQKMIIQRNLAKNTNHEEEINQDQTIELIDNSQVNNNTKQNNSRSYGYSINNSPMNTSIETGYNYRIQTRKQNYLRNSSANKDRQDQSATNSKNKSFSSVRESIQVGDSNQYYSERKQNLLNSLVQSNGFSNTGHNNHLYQSSRNTLTQATPNKQHGISFMMSSHDSQTTAAISPIKSVLKRQI